MKQTVLLLPVMLLIACSQPLTRTAEIATPPVPTVTVHESQAGPASLATSTPTAKSIITFPTPTPSPRFSPTALFWKVNDESRSPDGNWIATSFDCVGEGCSPYISVKSSGKKVEWVYRGEPDTGGYVVFDFYRWSKDGTSLYFAKVGGPVPNFSRYYGGAYDLLKLDLNNGEVMSLLQPLAPATTTLYDPNQFHAGPEAFALSPSETKVVYTLWGGNGYHFTLTLIIRNLLTNEDVPLAVYSDIYSGLGGFAWSPDERHIVFALATFGEKLGPDKVSLIRLDLSDFSLTTLVKDDERWLYPFEWEPNDTVKVFDFWSRPNYWSLDPFSGNLTLFKATATPIL